MNYRLATPADLEAVQQLNAQINPHTQWSLGSFASELQRAENYFVVAEQAGKVVGFLVGLAVFEDAELLLMGVSPSFQNQGVGGRLIACFVDFLESTSCVQVFLEVAQTNEPAMRLYYKNGFELEGVRPHYYVDMLTQQKISALVLKKTL